MLVNRLPYHLKALANLLMPAFLIIPLISCVTTAPTGPGLSAPKNAASAEALAMSESKLIEDVPHFPQTEDQCGPASLATLLNFQLQGQSEKSLTNPEELKSLVYIPGKGGSLALEMKAQLRQRGLLAYEISPSVLSVLREIEADNPVLVFLNLGFSFYPKWHFAVALGYDLNRQEIILHSGLKPNYRMPLSLFEKTWSRAGKWALLAKQPGELPATAIPSRMLQATIELEQLKKVKAANLSYQAMVTKWPEKSAAYFGLANTYLLLNDLTKASDAYRDYLDLDASNPKAWNNMAYSLAAEGCKEAALESAYCAIELGKGADNYWNTLKDIEALNEGKTGEDVPPANACEIPSCVYGTTVN